MSHLWILFKHVRLVGLGTATAVILGVIHTAMYILQLRMYAPVRSVTKSKPFCVVDLSRKNQQ